MRTWIEALVRRLGTGGALDNVRFELERGRFADQQVDALARRMAPPADTTGRLAG